MEEEYEYYEEPEYTMGYTEAMARTRGGAQVMGTQIEGRGRLARRQELIEKSQQGSQVERQFLSAFLKVQQLYPKFGADDEVFLKDKFVSLRHASYKNPLMFLLAYIALQTKERKKGLSEATKIGIKLDENFLEEDIIRYMRLLSAINL